MVIKTIYDLELNDANYQAPQPENILVKLKPHQLTSLYKAIDMENSGELEYKIKNSNLLLNGDNSNLANEDEEYTEVKIGTNVGIFGDMVGYGKTLIALSLIASNNLNNIHINPTFIKNYNSCRSYNYLTMSTANNNIKKDDNIINSTLIIVPRGPVYLQWEKMIL